MIDPAAIRPATDHEMLVVAMKNRAGHALTIRASDVLGAVEPLEVVVDEDGQEGDEDDPLGGAEVAAVDAGEEDPGEQAGPAVGRRGPRSLEPGAQPGLDRHEQRRPGR